MRGVAAERGRLNLPSTRTKFENQRAVVEGDTVELRPQGPRPGPRGANLTSAVIPEVRGENLGVCQRVEINSGRLLGPRHCGEWLQSGICKATTPGGWGESYQGTKRCGKKGSLRGRITGSTCQKGSVSSNRKRGATLPVILFPRPQKARQVVANTKFKATQSGVHYPTKVQNGASGGSFSTPSREHMGRVRGLEGRVSAHPHCERSQTIPSVQVQREGVCVYRTSFRPCDSATGVYESLKSRSIISATGRNPVVGLLRQLVDSLSLKRAVHSRREFYHRYTLTRLGWLINWEKSSLSPTQKITFLGASLDLITQEAFPTMEHLTSLEQEISSLLLQSAAAAATWMKVLGMQASLIDLVDRCRLRMRPLQLQLLQHFTPSEDSLDVLVPVPAHIRSHLAWWLDRSNTMRGVP